MFTGIIRYKGVITEIHTDEKDMLEVSILADIEETLKIGDSICVNGICLTIIHINNHTYTFQVISETIRKTTVGWWKTQDVVNIEISPRVTELSVDGHILSGHVDTIGTIVDIRDNVFFIKYPEELSSLIIDKGSIAIDGVSLTISSCFHTIFTVSIIPLTLRWTRFGTYTLGDKVNLEGDLRLKKKDKWYNDSYIGRYILSPEHAMEIALEISEKGKYTAPPNPHVGAIIVKEGKIISVGYHTSPGNSHAEIEAFKGVKEEDLSGCDLFVTLEPCCHVGRTGKCVDEIIKRGIKNVFIGVQDTDERVAGKGIQVLREAGVNVYLMNYEGVKNSLKEYLYQRETKLPYVYLKMATTLDNKCAGGDKSSKWITCEESRVDSHLIRARVQCIITTSQTVIDDVPQFTVRHPSIQNSKQPLVVVLNRNRRQINLRPGWIEWDKSIEECLSYVVKEHNIVSVLIEAGPTLCNEIIDKELWNTFVIYMNCSMIGSQGIDTFLKEGGIRIDDKKELGRLVECEKINNDIKIVLEKN